MKTTSGLLMIFLLIPFLIFAQARTRRLATPINHPSVNVFSPFISADGNVLVMISDNAEDYALTPYFSIRENNDWIDPIMFPKNIHGRLNFLYGFGLSADGKKMFLSTIKSPGVGGYDIWTTELRGKVWTEPQNMGAPINSKSHEACVSITTDGNTMYFMRCDKMDQNKASGCKIFSVKKKPNAQWDTPVELPANINNGNSQSPRIMADGETLFFSSDKMTGNKGGMDLYVTKFINGNWTDPQPMDFVNTEKDDQYVSANALGRYLLKDAPGARKNEIVEYLIPENLRPKGMMKLDGVITGSDGKTVPAYIAVVNTSNKQRVYSGKPGADGSYLLYLMEGSKYEVSVDPEKSDFSFASKEFDLTTDKIPQSMKFDAVIKSVVPGDEFDLPIVRFKPNSSDLDPGSNSELQRLSRVIKNNPALKFEIQVMLSGYLEDSVQSSPDLTEIQVDSVAAQYDEIDTMGQLYKKDTILVKTTFHNDRTAKQAKAVLDYLASQGVENTRLTIFVNAIPATLPENRKLTVKARAR
jgi:outer membrane protein OmpA-like peptidoglycan-associated protein